MKVEGDVLCLFKSWGSAQQLPRVSRPRSVLLDVATTARDRIDMCSIQDASGPAALRRRLACGVGRT